MILLQLKIRIFENKQSKISIIKRKFQIDLEKL